MADDSMVECPVKTTPAVRLGAYANAVRVKRTLSGECVLDFMLYSEVEDRAKVVSRVRISNGFAPQVVERLDVVGRELTVAYRDLDLETAV